MLPVNAPILADIMNPRVRCVSPDCTLNDAARQMSEAGISSLLVSEASGPLGILTERDIPQLLLDLSADQLREFVLGDVMRGPLRMVDRDTLVREAASLMQAQGLRHLVVVDKNGLVLGMVTLHKLMERVSANVGTAVDVTQRKRNEGLDVNIGLRAVRGDPGRYIRLLELFASTHGDDAAERFDYESALDRLRKVRAARGRSGGSAGLP